MTRPALTDPVLLSDPVAAWSAWRGAPRLGVALDGSPAWYVTRAQDVRAVLGDPRFRTSPRDEASVRRAVVARLGIPAELARPLTDSILDAGGADHTRLRKLVSRAFTVRRTTGLRPRVQAVTDELLDGLAGRVDLVERLARPLPITVICELVGVPPADRAAWGAWGDALVSFDAGRIPDALRAMTAHVQDLIARRRREPADDLVSDLVRAQEDDGDRLSDQEMTSLVITLVMAGHETTTHLIANSVVALLAAPEQLDRLRRDPAGWPEAVHELVRAHSPVQVARIRYAMEDVELGGVRIAEGEVVQPVLGAANRDPDEHPDPDSFDVARRAGRRGEGHLGFGHGVHYCLGAALARQEAEVALSSLFGRFPGLAPDGEPEWGAVPGMRRVARLPVRTS